MRTASVIALLFVTPGVLAQPSISFEPSAVVADGIGAGGRAVWFSVARESDGYFSRVVRREAVVADEDGDGVVRFELDGAVPWKSIWVTVDLASGELAAAAPEGYPLRQAAAPAAPFQRGPAGRLDRFRDFRGYAELLLVRPGTGAWSFGASDGGAGDGDGANDGVLAISLPSLQPIGDSPPAPESVAAGDVVVLIDPRQMELFAVRIPG